MERTLNQYLEFARSIARPYKKVRDEECISYIAYHLMLAYRKFNGNGTIDGYMYDRGRYACRRYMYKERQNRVHVKYNDNVAGYEPFDRVEFDDVVEYIDKNVNSKQSTAIKMYYLSGHKMKEIAETLQCSTQYVHVLLKDGIKRIQEKLHAE